MATLFVDKVDPQSGTSLEIGSSGDTITIPSGVTITNNGTQTGFGGANTPSFKAYGGTQAIADNTATVIAYNTELWDTDSDYDNSTYRFTPQVAGKYFVYSIIRVESGSSYNHLELRIRKNGGDMAHGFNSPKYYDSVNVCGLVDMNGSSDYIDFAIYQASGGSLNTNGGRQFNQGGAFKIIT